MIALTYIYEIRGFRATALNCTRFWSPMTYAKSESDVWDGPDLFVGCVKHTDRATAAEYRQWHGKGAAVKPVVL